MQNVHVCFILYIVKATLKVIQLADKSLQYNAYNLMCTSSQLFKYFLLVNQMKVIECFNLFHFTEVIKQKYL